MQTPIAAACANDTMWVFTFTTSMKIPQIPSMRISPCYASKTTTSITGPAAYRVNHLDLGPQKIREHKRSWEAFVAETRKPSPAVIATLSAYGSYEQIHSLQLVLQWAERIEYSRSYHLLDGNMDKMTDAVMEELKDFGPGVQIAFIDKPLPIEHCPCCGSGYYRKLDPPVVIRHTDPDWSTQSTCAIYFGANENLPVSF